MDPPAGTVAHPRIRPGRLEERRYQTDIASRAVDRNTLVVLPTGLGKTSIALRVMAEFLLREPTRSILFLAPTRPLVVQHARSVAETLLAPEPLTLTGAIPPDRRTALLEPPQVVVATPQVVGNDLGESHFPLATFSLIVFDEAHRAVGDYPYVAIGRANRSTPQARVLAMTASPGSRLDRIREVWTNLGIERFEYRTEHDADVVPYIHGVGVETVTVPVPADVRYLGVLLRTAIQRQADVLRGYDLLPTGEPNRRSLLEIGALLHRRIEAERRSSGAASGLVWKAVTAQAAAMKGLHALELIESQGVDALREFFRRQEPGPGRRSTPSGRAFLQDPDVVEVRRRLEGITIEHPKIAETVEIVTQELRRNPSARVIVFAQYRDTVDRLVLELERARSAGVRAARFVGQATHGDDAGLSQREQVALLDRFRGGEINCLVATSVAEEGLDIPATDLVIFYEPIPDVIRTIQRRGRTGRARVGRAVVLVAEGTRDVNLNRAAFARERRMHDMLERVEAGVERGEGPGAPEPRRVQRTLPEFS
jgi:ERCC4-related helicase